jgi:hypothetical protein
MNPLRFRLRANGKEMSIPVDGDYVERVILPSAEHEAGHIVAAHHLNARVRGIAVGFVSYGTQGQMFLQALYSWKVSTIQDKCVVKTAGPAADLFFHGEFDQEGVKRDLQDIQGLSGETSFDPYLEPAKAIIALRERECRCVANALRHEIGLDVERTLEVGRDNCVQALLLDEAQLLSRLSVPAGQRL